MTVLLISSYIVCRPIYMHCCIHSTYCVPIMNGRRRGTREESRKQALDSAWSMEMSKLTRDGTAGPVSRD